MFALITTVRQLLPFLGYIKSEESSGVNTEGGLSGPELEMLKTGLVWVDVLVIFWTGGSNVIGLFKIGLL